MKHITKIAGILFAAAALLYAQNYILPGSFAQITGDGSAHVIASSGTARTITFVTPSTNSAAICVGDVNVSSTRGSCVAPGGAIGCTETEATS